MNEITIGNKTYISSKRAAEITGYAKDYIGQLCREGRVDARLIGRNWYLLEESIREHRFGAAAKSAEAAPLEARGGVPAIDALWDSPRYEAEEAQFIAAVAKPEPLDTPIDPNERVSSPEFMSDMQSAWKEWFSERNASTATAPVEPVETDTAISEAYEPEGSPLTLYEPEEQVPITILKADSGFSHDTEAEEAESYGEPVAFNEVDEVKIVSTYYTAPQKRGSFLTLQVVLVLIGIVFASGALIGTGYLKINASVPAEAAAIGFLNGTKTLAK